MQRETVWITPPGISEKLSAWVYGDLTTKRAVIVLGHGLGLSKAHGLQFFCEAFASAGHIAVAFDYPTLGASQGQPRGQWSHVVQRRALSDVIDWAARQPWAKADQIVVWGFSFSGAHCFHRVLLALNESHLMQKAVSGLYLALWSFSTLSILRNTPAMLADLISRIAPSRVSPVYLPVCSNPRGRGILSTPDASRGFAMLVDHARDEEEHNALAAEHQRAARCAGDMIYLRASQCLDALLHSAIRAASGTKIPVLLVVADQDLSANPTLAVESVKRVQHVRMVHISGDHFDIFRPGEARDRTVRAQLEFLRQLFPCFFPNAPSSIVIDVRLRQYCRGIQTTRLDQVRPRSSFLPIRHRPAKGTSHQNIASMPNIATTYPGVPSSYNGPSIPNPDGNQAHISLYGYRPALALGLIGCITFGVLLIVHIFYMLAKRHTRVFQALIVFSCVCEVIGYAMRTYSHFSTFEIVPFIVSYCLITVSPVFLSASVYLALSRVLQYVPGAAELSPLKPRSIVTIFVGLDIATTALQSAGASLIGVAESSSQSQQGSAPLTADQANHILLAGLAAQCAAFLVYLGILTVIVRRSMLRQRQDADLPNLPKSLIVVLVSTSLLILTRTVFRTAETGEGLFSYASSHEYLFGILEYTPIVLSVAIWAAFPLWRFIEPATPSDEETLTDKHLSTLSEPKSRTSS
ncbi:uncharacterized protein L969DRAFT_94277 [Mixia osmundae IAM 14324]|uniref:Xaa-Pro dipeptidyl-peptidase-like domain-containing protein n=1 Tax=Mixia osmundae (strain CBS 9802 / IAM 14324 / JCM 22182 / KY 12970) TaxID=764103 RepID=G7E8D5_MIXOS|nr:uncharacterized protein L969DRAFT_94277 [Mixia osmundae IAM 14324]KEI39198.1 hypothetical protein L969DRAFT_94277 [Mixia osmundae IAM 14324]GAA99095.1 hypothetical protein E5Q_05784 [Mixia osmundae IAM 14324]